MTGTTVPTRWLRAAFLFSSLYLCLVSASMYRMPLVYSPYLTRENVVEVGSRAGVAGQEKDLHGRPGQGYYMMLEIGQPPQKLNVLVDTGSSNFAIAAAPHPDITTYFNTSRSRTLEEEGREVVVPYTQGNWHGYLAQDVVTLPFLANMTTRVSIACITTSENFYINGSSWQGILGMAYRDIARPDSTVEPFFEALVKRGGINNTFSLQLCGALDLHNDTDVGIGGTMIFGGIDPSLYEGTIVYTPIRKEWYYEVIIVDMEIDGHSLALDCKEYNYDKTIVDSGTTNLRLPHTVFNAVKDKIKRVEALSGKREPPEGFWTGEKVLCWLPGRVPWGDFPTLSLRLVASHNTSILLTISPQQYMRAVHETDQVGGKNDCFKFAIDRSDTGTVIGAVIMEAFYVIFDRENKRIGFAKSSCPNRDPFTSIVSVSGPDPYQGDAYSCGFVGSLPGRPVLVTVAYVMAGVCGISLIPVVLMVLQCQLQRCRRKSSTSSSHDISNLLKEEELNETQ